MTLLTFGDASAVYQPSDEDTACSARIPAGGARGFRMRRGDVLRVTDPLGGQGAALVACAAPDLDHAGEPAAGPSSPSTRDDDDDGWHGPGTGDVLRTSDGRRLFTRLRDDVGGPDLLRASTPGGEGAGDDDDRLAPCATVLRRALEPFGAKPDAAATTLNLFLRVGVETDGGVAAGAPRPSASDAVELRAERDLVCALAACPAAREAADAAGPIDFEVLPAVGG